VAQALTIGITDLLLAASKLRRGALITQLRAIALGDAQGVMTVIPG
jgi:hypothetical protein